MQRNSTKIIQITDTHLFADPHGELVGLKCDESLSDVVELVRKHEADAAALLFTGDASQDGSDASYLRLYQSLDSLQIPQYWIPGNHDELQQMQSTIGLDNSCFQCSFVVGAWRIILLNSAVPGLVSGYLSDAEMNYLHRALKECTETYILICLHHNPVPVDAAWLQRHALKNPEHLFAAIDDDDRVKAVVFGHIHQEYEHKRNEVLYLGSPSTCIQFHPKCEEFKLDVLNPGYRWFDLQDDGTFTTGVKRVEDKHYNIDFHGIGY